jgi:hypothetical protein
MIVYFDVFSVLVFIDEAIFLELAVAFVSRLTCCRQQRNINGYLRGYQALFSRAGEATSVVGPTTDQHFAEAKLLKASPTGVIPTR